MRTNSGAHFKAAVWQHVCIVQICEISQLVYFYCLLQLDCKGRGRVVNHKRVCVVLLWKHLHFNDN